MALMIGAQIPCLDRETDWIFGLDFDGRSSGNPTLIQFWAISCPMCKHNMPRSEPDRDVEKVKVAVQELGLTGPCAIDNDHAIGSLYQTGGV